MGDKTVVNWSGGSTLQTWTDGEWQILYAKDASGNAITLSLNPDDACRMAYALSPQPNEQFKRMREYMHAVYELKFPAARAESLREIANEIDCGGGCEDCTPSRIERGEFCKFQAAEGLRDLAKALDLKAEAEAEPEIAF